MARILIAEDVRTNQLILMAMLRQMGHTVTTASNGREAITAAEHQIPDVILMDMEMPVVNGWIATAYLQKQPALAHIPVIALTGHTTAHELDQALAAGCVACLSKPIKRERLLAALDPYVRDCTPVLQATSTSTSG
ncbi:MAG: response regulator [Herpetosiphonaceae bacterium]|nr:response regulator [Herpetosiphonaceae bacterium]